MSTLRAPRLLWAAGWALIALVAGCGGGGGGGGGGGTTAPAGGSPVPAATAPTISNLVLDSKGIYEGPYSVTNVTGSFTAVTNSGPALSTFNAIIFNAAGQNVGQITAPIQPGAGSTVQFSITVLLNQLALGTYSFQVSVTNSAGTSSNRLSGTYSYLPSPWTAVRLPPVSSPNVRLPRYGAVAAAGSKIYVISGGIAPYVDASRMVDAFDTTTQTWSALPNAPLERVAAKAVSVDGKIYVIGGYNFNSRTGIADVDVLDTATNTWSTAAPLPTPRYLSAVVALGRKIYVMGGTQSVDAGLPTTIAQPMDTVEVYDIATNTWSADAPLPQPRFALAAAVANGRIFTSGGYLATGPSTTILPYVSMYNPASNVWELDYSRNLQNRAHHALVSLNGTLFAIGGVYQSAMNVVAGITDTVESWPLPSATPSPPSWKKMASLPDTASQLTAVEIGGKLYVFGGSSVYIYSPELDVL